MQEDNVIYTNDIKKGIENIIYGLRLDPEDENLVDTPDRVARFYAEICEGLTDSAKKELDDHLTKTFPSTYNGLVIIEDVETWSLCPHHFAPVKYIVNLGYIPKDRVLGASKIPRLVTLLSHRPVLQETLTQDIVNYLEKINPLGIVVHVVGEHLCMKMRGIKSSKSKMITSSVSGCFESDSNLETKFYSMIGLNK